MVVDIFQKRDKKFEISTIARCKVRKSILLNPARSFHTTKKPRPTLQSAVYIMNISGYFLIWEKFGYKALVNLLNSPSPPRIFKFTDKTYTSRFKISRQLSGNFTKSLNVVTKGKFPRVCSNVRKCSSV